MRQRSCANCGAALYGPYCATCGQKVVGTDLSLREFLHETTHEIANWDGRVPSTLIALFFRPGLLTVDFLAGRRARWLSPLRAYLICSVAFFAGKPLVEAIAPYRPRPVAQFRLSNNGRPLTPEERQEVAEGLPGRIWGVERMERAAADPARLSREVVASFSTAMFLLLPVFALLTNLLWRGVRRRYPAHLYLALHLHAAFFGAAMVLWIAIGFAPRAVAMALELLFFGYLGWYGLVAFRRVFGQSWGRTLAKTLAVGALYFPILSIAALAMLGYAVARM